MKMLKKSFQRFAIPLRSEVQGTPSVACPLGGTTIHRIVVFSHLARGLFQLAKRKTWFSLSSILE